MEPSLFPAQVETGENAAKYPIPGKRIGACLRGGRGKKNTDVPVSLIGNMRFRISSVRFLEKWCLLRYHCRTRAGCGVEQKSPRQHGECFTWRGVPNFHIQSPNQELGPGLLKDLSKSANLSYAHCIVWYGRTLKAPSEL